MSKTTREYLVEWFDEEAAIAAEHDEFRSARDAYDAAVQDCFVAACRLHGFLDPPMTIEEYDEVRWNACVAFYAQ